MPSTGTKYKRSKIVFAVTSIALTLSPLGTELLENPAQFIGSPDTLPSARRNSQKKQDLYNSLAQKIDVGVRNDQMLRENAPKFKT